MEPAFSTEALPHDVEGYRRECRGASMEEFEQARPYPFLLYARSKLWDPELVGMAMQEGGDETRMVNYNIVSGGMTFLSPIRRLDPDSQLETISLGRSPQGNDVVVPVNSISTKHAKFLPPSISVNQRWNLVDLDSRNGTFLGEQRLEAQTPSTLDDGVYLRLGGNLLAWFLYPGRLWQLFQNPEEFDRLTDF